MRPFFWITELWGAGSRGSEQFSHYMADIITLLIPNIPLMVLILPSKVQSSYPASQASLVLKASLWKALVCFLSLRVFSLQDSYINAII